MTWCVHAANAARAAHLDSSSSRPPPAARPFCAPLAQPATLGAKLAGSNTAGCAICATTWHRSATERLSQLAPEVLRAWTSQAPCPVCARVCPCAACACARVPLPRCTAEVIMTMVDAERRGLYTPQPADVAAAVGRTDPVAKALRGLWRAAYAPGPHLPHATDAVGSAEAAVAPALPRPVSLFMLFARIVQDRAQGVCELQVRAQRQRRRAAVSPRAAPPRPGSCRRTTLVSCAKRVARCCAAITQRARCCVPG